jgi:hypothetical protein
MFQDYVSDVHFGRKNQSSEHTTMKYTSLLVFWKRSPQTLRYKHAFKKQLYALGATVMLTKTLKDMEGIGY